MRYQEHIYIQNENNNVRNKDILNFNMSSDICIFNKTKFLVDGVGKIDCSTPIGNEYDYIYPDTNILNLEFNVDSGSTISMDSMIRFEVYKFDNDSRTFNSLPVYSTNYEQLSVGETQKLLNLNLIDLDLDGEYIIKTNHKFNHCTGYLNKLNKIVDTSEFKVQTEYGIYDEEFDYYFMAMKQAEIPYFTQNYSNTPAIGVLTQHAIIPTSGQTEFVIQTGFEGSFILTLNGLTLTPNEDYLYLGDNLVRLSGETYEDDTITVFYSSNGGFAMVNDNFIILNDIQIGDETTIVTDNSFYNTTTGKYEIFTNITPQNGGDIIVTLNGATLASGIDFYQSITNPKKIILEGYLSVGDIINIIYFPNTGVGKYVGTNNPYITWKVNTPPKNTDGEFIVEISDDENFLNPTYQGIVKYQVGVSHYVHSFELRGNIGTKLFYRVVNVKNYKKICDNTDNNIVSIVSDTSYSEIVPIIITTNSINSY